MSVGKPLGIVAGSGLFPVELGFWLHEQNIAHVVAAHRGQSSDQVGRFALETRWVGLGALGEIMELFRRWEVQSAVFAGGIDRNRVSEYWAPDELGWNVILQLDPRCGDDALLKQITTAFEQLGVEITDPLALTPELSIPPGSFTGDLDEQEARDLKLGARVALALGPFDVGQTVVVSEGRVLAVEGPEGTDEAMKRAKPFVRRSAVVVKMAKSCQDSRFDHPCAGPATLAGMAANHIRVLGLQARRSILLSQSKCVAQAERLGLTIWGLKET